MLGADTSRLTAWRKLGIYPIFLRFHALSAGRLNTYNCELIFSRTLNVNLGYQWTRVFATTLGYRYLDVGNDNDDFRYDVSQDGLILGLSWRF